MLPVVKQIPWLIVKPAPAIPFENVPTCAFVPLVMTGFVMVTSVPNILDANVAAVAPEVKVAWENKLKVESSSKQAKKINNFLFYIQLSHIAWGFREKSDFSSKSYNLKHIKQPSV